MKRRVATLSLVLLGLSDTWADPLNHVYVPSASIYCLFDADCAEVPLDTSGPFALSATAGRAALWTRSLIGQRGTLADGLHGYLYQLDLSQVVPDPAAGIGNCIVSLTLDFGTPVTMDFDGDGVTNEQAFVVVPPDVIPPPPLSPQLVSQVGRLVTISFDPNAAVCAGRYSLFVGMVSPQPPRPVRAALVDSRSGARLAASARAPSVTPASIAVDPNHGIAGSSFGVTGRVAAGSSGARILWDDGQTAGGLADLPVSPDGSFSATLRVPSRALPGDALVKALAVGSDGSDMAAADFVVEPTPPGNLGGRLFAPGGSQPVSGAVVRAIGPDGAPAGTATTAEDGSYAFAGLIPGTYTLVASKDGLYFQETPFIVPPGGSGGGSDVIAVSPEIIPAPAIVTFVGGIAVPNPNSAFDGAYPVLISDQSSAKNTGLIATFPSLPAAAGVVNVRFWADVQFPSNAPPSERKVEFKVLDYNDAVLWGAIKTAPSKVYADEPALNYDAWTSSTIFGGFDMNVNGFPPGDLVLRVTPYVSDKAGYGKFFWIRMVDLHNRWFAPWVIPVNDPETQKPVKVIGSGGNLIYIFTGMLPASGVLPFNLPFTIPIFNKQVDNLVDANVPLFRESFYADPSFGLQAGTPKPELHTEVKLLGNSIFSNDSAFKPVITPSGELSGYNLPKFTAADKKFATIPLYHNGPGVYCWDPCPDIVCGCDCDVCAGWEVSVDFTLGGKVFLESTIESDLGLNVTVTPQVNGTLGGHLSAYFLCGVDVDVTGTIGVALPFQYHSKGDSAGFVTPCVDISGTYGGGVSCPGLPIGGGGSIGPATIYGCNNAAPWTVKASTTSSPFHVDPAPCVAANGNGQALAVWVQDESGIPGQPSTFVYYSFFDGLAWSGGLRLMPDAALVASPKVVYLAQDRALGIWVQNRASLQDALAQGFAEMGDQEIYWSLWENGEWSTPAALTDDLHADTAPALAGDPGSGAALAAWSRRVTPGSDPASNFFGIAASTFNGAVWQPMEFVDTAIPAQDCQVDAKFDSAGEPWLVWMRDLDADMTTYSNRQLRAAHYELRAGWVHETISGAPEGSYAPSIALDGLNHPFVAFMVPRAVLGATGSGVGNRNSLWTAYRPGLEWQVGPVGQDIFAEGPAAEIKGGTQAMIMFRRFSADELEHRDGDLALAMADLSEAPLVWGLDYLTDDEQTNWKTDFDLDRETLQSVVVNVKQSPTSSAFVATDRPLVKAGKGAKVDIQPAAAGGPAITMLAFADKPDLSVTPADLHFSEDRPAPGVPIDITVDLVNSGFKPTSGSFLVQFFLGEAGDTLIGEELVTNSLPLNIALPLTVPFTPPSGGLITITVVLDAGETLDETSEANNNAQATLGNLPAPVGVVAFGDMEGNLFSLSWDAPETNGVVRFDVFRSGSEGGPFEYVGSATGFEFADTLVKPGLDYFYSIVAVDQYGVTSPASSPISAILPPPLLIRRAGDAAVLAWPNPSTRFLLQQGVFSAGADAQWTSVPVEPVVADPEKRVTVPADNDVRLFRLIAP
jgi:hypothetical protein